MAPPIQIPQIPIVQNLQEPRRPQAPGAPQLIQAFFYVIQDNQGHPRRYIMILNQNREVIIYEII